MKLFIWCALAFGLAGCLPTDKTRRPALPPLPEDTSAEVPAEEMQQPEPPPPQPLTQIKLDSSAPEKRPVQVEITAWPFVDRSTDNIREEYEFVELSGGKDYGIEEGFEFTILDRRGDLPFDRYVSYHVKDHYVGKVRVTKVSKTSCKAEILEADTVNPMMVGDVAITLSPRFYVERKRRSDPK